MNSRALQKQKSLNLPCWRKVVQYGVLFRRGESPFHDRISSHAGKARQDRCTFERAQPQGGEALGFYPILKSNSNDSEIS